MKNQKLIIASILFAGLLVSGAILGTGHVQAQSLDTIVYPIVELGNCENEEACKTYCDDLAHINECLDFAERNGLIPPEEIEQARAFAELGGIGPGGCTSKESCELYCENIANIQECLDFGRDNGLIPPDELEEAEAVARVLEEGGALPGNCQSKRECELYCEDGAHIDECLVFAERAGFLEEEELEIARKVAPLMREGRTPGGCQSQQECESYCEDAAHIDECVAFGVELGFITPEEAEIVRKTGGFGPGGCNSQESCDAYCNDPAHQDECFAFAVEHDLIPEEDIAHIKDGVNQLREGLQHAPPEVRSCLRDEFGDDIIGRIESGTFTPGPSDGDHIRSCFEQFHKEGEIDHRVTEALAQAPPEVKECIAQQVGGDAFARLQSGDGSVLPEIGPRLEGIFTGCFEEFEKEHFDDFRGDEVEFHDEFPEGVAPEGTAHGGINFPPHIEVCLNNTLGGDFKEKLFSGALHPTELEGYVADCIRKDREQGFIDNFEESTHLNVEEFLPPPEGIDPSHLEGGFVAPQGLFEQHEGGVRPSDFAPKDFEKDFVPPEHAPPFDGVETDIFSPDDGFPTDIPIDLIDEFKDVPREFTDETPFEFRDDFKHEPLPEFEEKPPVPPEQPLDADRPQSRRSQFVAGVAAFFEGLLGR